MSSDKEMIDLLRKQVSLLKERVRLLEEQLYPINKPRPVKGEWILKDEKL